MAFTRRHVLQLSAAGCASLSLAKVTQANDSIGNIEFSGAGIYLYPAWGEPQPYLVTLAPATGSTLEFRDTASREVLWTQTLSLTGAFAGKLDQ